MKCQKSILKIFDMYPNIRDLTNWLPYKTPKEGIYQQQIMCIYYNAIFKMIEQSIFRTVATTLIFQGNI